MTYYYEAGPILLICGYCGEEIEPGNNECLCPGSDYCDCEFARHHRGCCEIMGRRSDPRPGQCTAYHEFGDPQ